MLVLIHIYPCFKHTSYSKAEVILDCLPFSYNTSMPELIETIKQTTDSYCMLPSAPVQVVLMVSGGVDSTAMARLLPVLFPEHRYTILHVNHGLRGADADADEAFVVALAEELGIPCEVRRIDLPALQAAEGGNIEELGRQQRYGLAESLLQELAAADAASGRIATAHTADDNAETFMMRVIKGAGTAALAGIPPVRGQVIRPLIGLTRAELAAWLTANGHPWREDATNADTSYLRAFVRHQLLPLMVDKNPRFTETLGRSLRILADESALVGRLAAGYADDPLSAPDTALARRALRLAYEQAGGDPKDLPFEMVERLRLDGGVPGFALDLPGGFRATSVADAAGSTLRITQQPVKQPAAPPFSATLALGEPLQTPLGTMLMQEVDPELFQADPVAYAKANAGPDSLLIDADSLLADVRTENRPLSSSSSEDTEPSPVLTLTADVRTENRPLSSSSAPAPAAPAAVPLLSVASLQPGDRFSPLGMPGQSKLVSDLLIDRKVPRQKRTELLKVTHQDEIIWVVGIQPDDRFKVKPESRRLLSIIIRLS